jgi:hypothetical protein
MTSLESYRTLDWSAFQRLGLGGLAALAGS